MESAQSTPEIASPKSGFDQELLAILTYPVLPNVLLHVIPKNLKDPGERFLAHLLIGYSLLGEVVNLKQLADVTGADLALIDNVIGVLEREQLIQTRAVGETDKGDLIVALMAAYPLIVEIMATKDKLRQSARLGESVYLSDEEIAHYRATAEANRQKAVWARTLLTNTSHGGIDAPTKPDPDAFSKERIGERAREHAREILEARREKQALLAAKRDLILKRWTIEKKGSLYAILSPTKHQRVKSADRALEVLYEYLGADAITQLKESTDCLLKESPD